MGVGATVIPGNEHPHFAALADRNPRSVGPSFSSALVSGVMQTRSKRVVILQCESRAACRYLITTQQTNGTCAERQWKHETNRRTREAPKRERELLSLDHFIRTHNCSVLEANWENTQSKLTALCASTPTNSFRCSCSLSALDSELRLCSFRSRGYV